MVDRVPEGLPFGNSSSYTVGNERECLLKGGHYVRAVQLALDVQEVDEVGGLEDLPCPM